MQGKLFCRTISIHCFKKKNSWIQTAIPDHAEDEQSEKRVRFVAQKDSPTFDDWSNDGTDLQQGQHARIGRLPYNSSVLAKWLVLALHRYRQNGFWVVGYRIKIKKIKSGNLQYLFVWRASVRFLLRLLSQIPTTVSTRSGNVNETEQGQFQVGKYEVQYFHIPISAIKSSASGGDLSEVPRRERDRDEVTLKHKDHRNVWFVNELNPGYCAKDLIPSTDVTQIFSCCCPQPRAND